MAMKTSHYTAICLLLFLLTFHLHLSQCAEDSSAYDIDYRGPETHPSMAPPSHFRERPWGSRRDFKEPPKAHHSHGTNPRLKGGVEKIKG